MNPSITLGRVLGIRVSINWSWLVVLVLIVWTLAANVFPAQNEGLSDATYLVMAIAAALLFFASLLLHELSTSPPRSSRCSAGYSEPSWTPSSPPLRSVNL